MRRQLAVLVTLSMTAPALACGPGFPEALLDDRAGTLSELPKGTFAEEAAHLFALPAAVAFKPAERANWIYESTPPPTRDVIERAMLGAGAERADGIRRLGDAATAYAAGEGLPEDARIYLAGAVAFAHGDRGEAVRRFASVLELPPDQRAHYGVWAAYMLGRSSSVPAEAALAFQKVRALVAAGANDPLGLAVDSYGEEARLRLGAGDDNAAISLYAEQTALGSLFGRASLLRIARAIVADPARLERDVADPMAQRLLTIYLMTRSYEVGAYTFQTAFASASSADGPVGIFLDVVDRRGLEHVEGAGRLAALAYRSGRYDLAARLAAKGNDGFAAWVRAKLALRDGNADAAAKAYAEAAQAFPKQNGALTDPEDSATATSYCRVEGEAGTLALARGEYVAALENLYAAPTYWTDAAFVAERVLTLDELTAFVERHTSAPVKQSVQWRGERNDGSLRSLFARRLLRADRYDDAIAYFDDPELKKKAIDYAAARRAALSGGRIERAEQWFHAATIARKDGLQLLGYELDPDYLSWDGEFELPSRFGYEDLAEGVRFPPMDTPLKIAAGPSLGEGKRVAMSASQPDLRFHYRYIATDFASRAADLVPNRSQAYAAILCQAAGWVMRRNQPAARAIYERYVNNGPYVPWAAKFGTQCEEPSFAGAAKRLHAERIATAKRIARYALPLMLMIGVLGGLFAWRRHARGTR
jgi:hypothetical protein